MADKVTRAMTLEEMMLSSYERGLMNMGETTKADVIVRDNLAKEELKRVLGMTLKKRMPDGTEVETSALTLAIIGAVSDMIQKPSITKVKEMASILGELKDTTSDLQISIVDRAIQDLAITEVTSSEVKDESR